MTRAPTAQDAGYPCRECSGRGGFYTDNGPAPCWEDCSDCDGAGDFDDLGVIERAVVRSPVMMGGFEREAHTGLIHQGEDRRVA